ncbi:MAG: DUF1592 domain-containing protein [Nannocystaceae bacterium]|nr:DUF1592 domain-containing protein [Nannocystaceae bacterium]
MSLACSLTGGCYVGLDEAALDTDAETDGGGGDDGEDGDDDVGPDGKLCRAHESPLRRLTVRQYTNTLEDLFPGQDFSELNTLLPADPRSHGFENTARLQVPSAALIEGYQRGALEVTQAVFASGDAFETATGLPLPGSVAEANLAAESVIRDLGRRIFRRPVRDDDVERYGQVFAASFEDTGALGDDFLVAVSLTVSAMLQSPNFVYLLEEGIGSEDAAPGELVPLGAYEVASRLSYFLWDSMPDDALLAAAEADALSNADEIEAQVRRMIELPRGRDAVVNLHRQWLGFDDVLFEMKDPATYPQWSQQTLLDAHAQMERFVEHNFFEGDGTLRGLLTSTEVPVSPALAELMDVTTVGEDWQLLDLDPTQRRGVLTLPGFLAGHSHPVNPSPVLRGQFVRERVLCAPVPPPPDDVDATPPEDVGDAQTNRERYDIFLDNASCAGCHTLLHGIGYPFEIYDSVGAFRTTDAGKTVDASGVVTGVPGLDETEVSDALEMMDVIAEADATQQCAATQFFRSGFGRAPEPVADRCMTDDMVTALRDSEGDLHELIVSLARSTDFRFRRIPQDL